MIIDENRLARQVLAVDKFININNGVGASQMCTGFGKTYMAFLAIKKFKKEKEVHVCVPTLVLQQQWQELIEKELKNYNIKVFVINTYVTEKRQCDFLITDEGDRVSNEDAIVFNKVIDNCQFVYCWCLSATFTKEQLQFLADRNIPLIDTVTREEAIKNKWISPCIYYNLAVSFTQEEQQTFDTETNIIKSHFRYFEGDLKIAYRILKDKTFRKQYCAENGYKESEIGYKATKLNSAIAVRKATIYGAKNKLTIIPELLQKLEFRKTILFSQTIKYATEVHKLLPDISTIYHSTLKGKKIKEDNLNLLKDNKVRLICTAKALNAGVDVPELNCGINASYTSTERDFIQKVGRISRFIENKQAIFISLYIEDCDTEKNWLKKSMKNVQNIRWINSVQDINV